MEEDFYKTLGVSRTASQADIQKAYRRLASKHHPDLNPDDKAAKERFQNLQRAYEVLNDPSKRELYDRYGSSFETMGTGGPGGGTARRTWSPGGGPGQFEDVDFSQFFGERFGTGGGPEGFADVFKQFAEGASGRQRRGRAPPRRGQDLTHELEVPLATAVSGGEARISVQRADGNVETISVKIPPGVEDGQKIRLRGQGEKVPGAATPGDLIILVRVAPHPHFAWRGKNLEVRVPVTLAEAALGAAIDIPTPKGTVSVRVPPGTSSGKKLRVRGHGVPVKSGEPGDLLAEIQIVLPPSLDDESREAIRKLGERHSANPREHLRW
jgi:DnaJ-class molecular chaperone